MVDILSPITPVITPGRYGATFDSGPGITVSTRTPNGLVQIAGWDDFEEQIKAGLKTLGYDSSGDYRKFLEGKSSRLFRTGPDKILIEGIELSELPKRNLLNKKSIACLDLGHSRTIIHINGSECEDVLARLAPIDFRLKQFSVGHFVQTGIHGISVLIARTEEQAFDIFVTVTLARSLWEWICLNSEPFGYEIAG